LYRNFCDGYRRRSGVNEEEDEREVTNKNVKYHYNI